MIYIIRLVVWTFRLDENMTLKVADFGLSFHYDIKIKDDINYTPFCMDFQVG